MHDEKDDDQAKYEGCKNDKGQIRGGTLDLV